MPTTVELVSPTDSITFHATPDVNGWVYDNKTLDDWYRLPKTSPKIHKRPNAHGAYGLGQIFTDEALPVIVGQRFDETPALALAARERLAGFFEEGNPVVMRVNDELGTTSRIVWIVDFVAPFHHGFDHFNFDMALVAPDPRRYGAAATDTEGMPSAGTGLVWNLGTAGSGLYFDWGTEGVLGRVEYTNTGRASTFPRIEVGGAGSFDAGFRITEMETGRELTFTRPTVTGDVIVFDSRTERATILNGGGDVTGFLSSRKWFEIPKGATRRYQITPLGSVAGSPTITLYAAPAYL